MRGAKYPSKYMSLELLREIRDNQYRDKTGKDYVDWDVDQLIFEKANKQFQATHNRIMKELEEEEQQA